MDMAKTSTRRGSRRRRLDRIHRRVEMRRFCFELQEAGFPTDVVPLHKWLNREYLRLQRVPNLVARSFIGEFLSGLANSSPEEPLDVAAGDKDSYVRWRSTFRFLIRLLVQHEDATTTSQTWNVLQRPAAEWQQGLLEVSRKANQRIRGRVSAAAPAEEVAEYLGGFMHYVVQVIGGEDPPAYRFDAGKKTERFRSLRELAARTEIAASNNGHLIKLPSWVAATNDPELNRLFYLYVAAHEVLHTSLGSFDYSWRSPRGRMIKKMLRPYRNKSRRHQASTKARRIWRERILQKEGYRIELKKLPSTPLVQFLEAFGEDASLMRFLVNGFEDGRLERTIADRLSGLHQIHEQVQATYSQDVMSSPDRMSSDARLLNAIGFYAARRPWQHWVPKQHQQTFDEAKQIIQRIHQLPRQSVYDSLLGAMSIYDLISSFVDARSMARSSGADQAEDEDSEGGASGRLENQTTKRSISEELGLSDEAEDIDSGSMRHALTAIRGGRWGDSDQADRLETDMFFKVKDAGVWLPEFTSKGLVEKVIHLTVKNYANKTPPLEDQLEPLDYPFPRLSGSRSIRSPRGSRFWHRDGEQLADDRFAEYFAAVHAGDDAYLVTYDRLKATSDMFVTIILDASVSIEAKRTSLGGNTSLQRMLQMGSWLAQGLESQGIPHEAFAGVSGGVRLVQLHQMSLPLSHSIHSFRALGAGGFRLGAMLRAVSSKRSELELPRGAADHRIIVLTDGDEKYVNVAVESTFVKLHDNHCPMCTNRHRCLITHARGGMDQRSQSRNLYGSSSHALKDIRHAIDGGVGVGHGAANEVLVLAFSDAMTIELWDEHLGSRWVKSISSKLAAREVSRFLEKQPV